MKRLFVFISILILAIAGACKVDAQVTARTADSHVLRRGATYYSY
jgi:hypothetical protein